MDKNQIVEYLEIARPYLRWSILAVYGLLFLYVNRLFLKDPILRAWILQSFQEGGKASGKSLSGFIFVKLIAFATLCAIVYSPNHILPEFFLISLLTFVASLYGIKFATQRYGRVGDSSTTTETSSSSETTTVTKSPVVEDKTKTEDKKSNQPVSDNEIG